VWRQKGHESKLLSERWARIRIRNQGCGYGDWYAESEEVIQKLANKDVPFQWSYLKSGSRETWYTCISHKISELQNLVAQTAPNWSSSIPRIYTKIRHLRGRLQHLTEGTPDITESEEACIQQLRSQLDQVERVVMDTQGESNATAQATGVQKLENPQGPSAAGSSDQMADMVSTRNAGEVHSIDISNHTGFRYCRGSQDHFKNPQLHVGMDISGQCES